MTKREENEKTKELKKKSLLTPLIKKEA